MSDQLKTIYLESCLEELKVNKPGNHSLNSKIMGMYSEKFLLVSKISAKFLVKKNLSLGEMIFYSTKLTDSERIPHIQEFFRESFPCFHLVKLR